tara:strand:- start:33 stop:1094 length:1062 start_codon:yes stop_codon:yes gene_type:complete
VVFNGILNALTRSIEPSERDAVKRAAFLCDSPDKVERVYGQGRREAVAGIVELYPQIITSQNFAEHAAVLPELDAVFSTWGMPLLAAEQLAKMAELKAVFYAAGSVKGFAAPLLQHGLVLCSGWGANAVPVAEFTLAQVLLSCKGYFRNTRDCNVRETRRDNQVFGGPGVFGEVVGLVGLGMVGRAVAELLRTFELQVLAYDPYVDRDTATELGVELVELSELFARSFVVSNHLPNIPATEGLLDGTLFVTMRPDATFINTGRGAQVVEGELIDILRRRPDVTALLDVTLPEPPEPESAFYTLPNVQLSSHIAGSMNDELVRMADHMIEECARWQRGEALRYQVTEAMLQTMA